MAQFAIDKTRHEEQIALNSDIEMNAKVNQQINYELNEGAGYDSRNDITHTQHAIRPPNKHTNKIIIILLLYCVFGVTYLLFLNSNNNCQCTPSIIAPSVTSTSMINVTKTDSITDTPSINPSTSPTNNPTISTHKTYTHSIGDYKISLQNTSHDNWLLCDGSFVDPNHYIKLFNIIGYSFGSKLQGSVLLFALPDAKNQIMGINGDKYKIGDKIGKRNMSLNINHIPSHSHLTTHNGQCRNTHGYSENEPYLSQSCGLLKNSIYAYSLATTASLPDSIRTSDVGNGNSFELYQPTIFIGNLFIYVGNHSHE